MKQKKLLLLLVGIVLLTLTALWSFLVAPLLLRLQDDFSLELDVLSVDRFYDSEQKEFEDKIYSRTTLLYNTIASDGHVNTINNSFTVTTDNGDTIFSVDRLYGIDRVTREHASGYGDSDREGYLFAPRNLQKNEPFTYWHINYDVPAEMSFVAEETIHGLRTYKYESRYDDVSVDQTENLTNLPEVGKTRGVELDPHLTIWVEPVTGLLVSYTDDTFAYFYDLSTGRRLEPWNHFSNQVSETSVVSNIEYVELEKLKVRFFLLIMPVFFTILSILLIARALGFLKYIQQKVSIEYFRILTGSIIVVTGMISLVGWVFNIEALIRIVPIANAMNPLTALSFIALGLALLLQNVLKGKLTIAFLVPISIICSVRLIESLGLIGTEIDLVLLRETIIASEFPARMAQYTALSFLLISIVPLSSHITFLRKLRLSEILSSVVFFFSAIGMVAFFVGSNSVISIPTFFFAAFHTVLLFMIASAMMYFYYREERSSISFKNWLSISSVLLFFIFSTIVLASLLETLFTNAAEAEFIAEVERNTKAIEERSQVYISTLNGAQGLLSASEAVTREEWQRYVDALEIENNFPGIQGIGYSVFVTPEEKSRHIAQIQSEGFPDFTIKPEGNRDIYTSIVYLEPFDERNRQAFGFDMFSESTRRLAMEQARDSGEPKTSGRITLVQEIDQDVQPGFLIYIPYYGKNPHTTLEQRRENIVGYVYSPFRARNFFEGIIGSNGIANVGLRIEDGILEAGDNILFDDANGKLLPDEEPRFSESRVVYVAGRPWILTYNSTSNYGVTSFSRVIVPAVILSGILVSILIAFIFYILSTSRQKAEAYAKEVTKDIEAAKAQDEAILFSIEDGLIATDDEGRIILINPSFTKILGWKEAEVLGKKLTDVIPMFDKDSDPVDESFRPITKALRDRAVTSGESSSFYERKDGTIIPVSISVSPVLLKGELLGVVEVFRDITKEKEIDTAKTEFVSLASHQLRTPLTAINWHSEALLKNQELTEKQQKYAQQIFSSTRRMTELVNALLNISRLELGTFSVEPEDVSVPELAQSVIDELQPTIAEKHLTFTTDIDSKLPLIQADPKLLTIVIQNLLSNAMKYTEDSGNVSLHINTDKASEELIIQVSDDGIGIPKDQQKDIFTKLFRASNVLRLDTDGTGLGLYMVKSIVEHSQGSILFTSTEGEGSTFYVRLPMRGMKAKEGPRTLE